MAFAYKESDEELNLDAENGLIFIGLISEMDPPRPESVAAVAQAKKAGIKTVMITGDHKVTAVAIAKKIGIFAEGDLAVTGLELDAMSDKELDDKIEKSPFTPEFLLKTKSGSLTPGKERARSYL